MRLRAFRRTFWTTASIATLLGTSVSSDHAQENWHRGAANNLQNCEQLWRAVDLPTYRPDAEVNKTPVCHRGFVLSHNDLLKTPDWVIERLSLSVISGPSTRPEEDFRAEPDVPPSARATDADYKGSGFDRGHQAPSADFKSDEDFMRDTFVFSNAVPQVGRGFNQSIWALFEEAVRDFIKRQESTETYVITGPIHQDPDGRTITISADANPCGNSIKLVPPPKASICAANNRNHDIPCDDTGVAVPAALYKIIYDPQLNRSNGFLMPNVSHSGTPGYMSVAYVNKFRTTVSVIEEYTGLQFFTSMLAGNRHRLAERCSVQMLH